MSHVYNNGIVSVTCPDDLDPAVAASVNLPFQQLADAITTHSYALVSETFTGAVTSFTLPSNALPICFMTGCGGGGGGGGGGYGFTVTTSTSCSGSGGGGAPFGVRIMTLVPGTAYTATVGFGGSGGAGGIASSTTIPTAASNGQESTFDDGSTIFAKFPGGGAGHGIATATIQSIGHFAPGGTHTPGVLFNDMHNSVLSAFAPFGPASPGSGGFGTNKIAFKQSANVGYRGFDSETSQTGGSGGSEGTDNSSHIGGGGGGGGGGGAFGAGGAGGAGGNGNTGSAGSAGSAGTSGSANTGAGGGGGGGGGCSDVSGGNGGAGGDGGSGKMTIYYFVPIEDL